MTHTLAFLLALGGFSHLALAMVRHQEQVFGRESSPRATRACRLVGWVLVIACLAWCVGTWGWGLGLVIASGHTSAGAGLVFCALIVIDRRRQAQTQARVASTGRPARAAPRDLTSPATTAVSAVDASPATRVLHS